MTEIKIQQAPPLEEHYTPFCKSEPAIQSHWSPSSLDVLQTCPRKYALRKIERWESKDTTAMNFGKLFHQGIEFHTQARQENKDYEFALRATVRFLHRATVNFSSIDSKRSRETLLRAVVWYLEEYRHSPITPIRLRTDLPALELEWELPLPLTNPDGEPYILRGHFDEVAFVGEPVGDEAAVSTGWPRELHIPERKTTGRNLKDRLAEGKPDNQTASYSLAGAIVLPGHSVEILLQVGQLLVGSTRFGVRSVRYSRDELAEFVADTVEWLSLAERFAERRYWPMNRTACHKFGGCEFRGVCSADPSVRETILASEFTKLPSVWEIAGFRNFLGAICPA